MNRTLLLALALPLMAAAPTDRPISLSVPSDAGLSFAPAPVAHGKPTAYQPAPLPNRDVALAPVRASNEPSLAPTLFTTRTQFRGDGFSPGSTAQSEQEKRLRPGAGISLKMPLSSQ